MQTKLLITAALAALALGTPALAADLAVKAPPVAAPVYNWGGAYIGGFAGYGFGNQNLNNGSGPAGYADYTANWETHGPMAGGEIGYNWQSGQFVFGVEANGAWTNIQGFDNYALTDVNGNAVNDANKLKWVGSVLARGGLAVDRLLLFFTGGWAFGDLTHTNTDVATGIDTFSVSRSGLAAGGGMAYAITDNLIGKIEYRYYDLGTYTRAGNPTLTPNGQSPYSVANTYSTVLLGLDFKFGGSPVVAKY
jgi:outer membrane immunogenic protein